MALSTNHLPGQTITAADINAIAAAVNAATPGFATAPAGSLFVCPVDGTVNSSSTLARPSNRTDIFFRWHTTVQPTNAIDGDEVVFF